MKKIRRKKFLSKYRSIQIKLKSLSSKTSKNNRKFLEQIIKMKKFKSKNQN
jgi:hypothetical protein